MIRHIILVISFLLVSTVSLATTYYVCDDGTDCNAGDGSGWSTGSDSNNGTSKSTPFKTIYKGEDTASCGDTVIVGDGTYDTAEDGNDMIEIGGHLCTDETWLTIKAENQWGAAIDGSVVGRESYRGIFFDEPGGNVRYVRIEDFEIKYVSHGVRVAPDSEDAIHHIYLYRLKIHDVDFVGVNTTAYSEYVTVDSCTIYNIYGSEGYIGGAQERQYWYHNHGMYLNGKDHLVKNNVVYQPEGGMAIRIDGYNGTAPAAYSMMVVNNTLHGIQSPYPNPECCPSSPYDVPWQAGLIGFFNTSDNATSTVYVENNVLIDPPGDSNPGYPVAIAIGEAGDESCTYGGYTKGSTYIRNNVTDVAYLLWNNANCSTGFGALSNNTTSATLTDDLTDYANNDYTLKSGGDNLIDAGLGTNAPPLDILGVLRPQGVSDDIGAYEYEDFAGYEGVGIQ